MSDCHSNALMWIAVVIVFGMGVIERCLLQILEELRKYAKDSINNVAAPPTKEKP